MKWYRKIVAKFAEWLQPEHKYFFVEDLPEHIGDKTIYIVGDKVQPWLMAFNCPCGCNNVIHLNLLKNANPCWKFNVTIKKKISISPSVWRTTGCKSHFIVENSKIKWVTVK